MSSLARAAAAALLLALAPASAAAPSEGRSPAAPASAGRRLAYVESSVGLVPPTLDGGGTELEMGDVDGDGHLDLVSIGDHGSPYVNTDQHGVMVWFGDGAGSWGVVMTGEFGYGGIALGDVNGDGFMDVGYGMHHNYSGIDLGDQLLEVALGDGSGSSWTPWDDGLATNGEDWGMFSTDFADVDNDGDLDVGSNSFGCCAGVHVYLNQGDGTWVQSFGFLGGNSADEIVFGDINGDGNADFAVSQQYGTVYLGDGSGGFALDDGNLPAGGSSGRLGVSLGDVNGDGREDLAFRTSSGGLEVWAWTGPGTLDRAQRHPAGERPVGGDPARGHEPRRPRRPRAPSATGRAACGRATAAAAGPRSRPSRPPRRAPSRPSAPEGTSTTTATRTSCWWPTRAAGRTTATTCTCFKESSSPTDARHHAGRPPRRREAGRRRGHLRRLDHAPSPPAVRAP